MRDAAMHQQINKIDVIRIARQQTSGCSANTGPDDACERGPRSAIGGYEPQDKADDREWSTAAGSMLQRDHEPKARSW
jgi:hypothetical protein